MNIYTIYKATCINTNISYIGFDSHWPKRKGEHKTAAKYNTKNNKFYNAINKHGWDTFIWSVVYQSLEYDHCLNTMEPYFIQEFNSKHNGYNSTHGGEGIGINSRWWNNGIFQNFTEEAPGPDFILGRLNFDNVGGKIGTEIQRGKFWINNHLLEHMIKGEIPIGYHRGRLLAKAFNGYDRTKIKGTHWWNNGKMGRMSIKRPGEDYVQGRLPMKLHSKDQH